MFAIAILAHHWRHGWSKVRDPVSKCRNKGPRRIHLIFYYEKRLYIQPVDYIICDNFKLNLDYVLYAQ